MSQERRYKQQAEEEANVAWLKHMRKHEMHTMELSDEATETARILYMSGFLDGAIWLVDVYLNSVPGDSQ